MIIKTPLGEWPMPDEFTLREMRQMKNLTGLLPGEIEAALDKGDLDVVLAMVILSAGRAGQKVTEDQVLELRISDIDFVDEVKPKAAKQDPTTA